MHFNVISSVASFTDAWIETSYLKSKEYETVSHLLQMRGLKLLLCLLLFRLLSRIFYRCVDWNVNCCCHIVINQSRIFYRCVDWNIKILTRFYPITGRIFYRCVDWNYRLYDLANGVACRIFYRCVDWNVNLICSYFSSVCRIFYRCVDWNTEETKRADNEAKSHLLQMRGLKPGR